MINKYKTLENTFSTYGLHMETLTVDK